jgi:hypothetical protein
MEGGAMGRHLLTITTLLALLGLISGSTSAAELTTAEIGAMPNDVTVEQGGTASFQIWVGATGQLDCAITQDTPSTATVPTAYGIAAAGTVSFATPSAPLAFFAGPPSTSACAATWIGAPGPYRVAATVSTHAATPLGDYLFALSETAGTVVITNPPGASPALSDDFPTTIRVHVVEAQDTTAPVLSLPDDIEAEAEGPGGAVVVYAVTAIDDVDGPVDVTCVPASGSTFPIGTTEVACNAIDAAGNPVVGGFDVTVMDTNGPALTVPAGLSVDATSAGGAMVQFQASANDLVDGDVPVVCEPPSGSIFPNGETTVRCTATDSRGNAGDGSFVVTVIPTGDGGPMLSVPDPITAEAEGPSGAAVDYEATASDPDDGVLQPVCTPAAGTTFPLGSTTVECEVTDSDGKSVSGRFVVSVVDTTAPALKLPAKISTAPNSAYGAWVIFVAKAVDVVDGRVRVDCGRPAYSRFEFGTTTVKCTAADRRGNTASESFTVTVSAFRFKGFYSPVANPPAWNVVRRGSTVSVRWTLSGQRGTTFGLEAVAKGWPQTTALSCPAGKARRDATAGGWWHDWNAGRTVYRWRAPQTRGCWKLEVRFNDGSTRSAYFRTK